MPDNYVQLEHLNHLIHELEFGTLKVTITVSEGVVTYFDVEEKKKIKFDIERDSVKLLVTGQRMGQKPVFDRNKNKIDNRK